MFKLVAMRRASTSGMPQAWPREASIEAARPRRPDALDDEDQHLSSRPAAVAPLKERECGHHSNAGSLDMLDEGGPLRAGD
jgi:hypothetical protein